MSRAGRGRLARGVTAVSLAGVAALVALGIALAGDGQQPDPMRTAVASPPPVAEKSAPEPEAADSSTPAGPAASAGPSETAEPDRGAEAGVVDVARALPVIDRATPIPEYRRASFGDGWRDLDRDGCSTRNEILARDLLDVEWMTGRDCTVASGVLHDPYTGRTIDFQHDAIAEPGNAGSQGVQIDHIVSLSAAHRGGAWAWTAAQRIAFSNDPGTLIAVDGPTNASKGDRGPGEWMPEDPAYWCAYATSYTTIVAEHALAVDLGDKQMLVDVLEACG